MGAINRREFLRLSGTALGAGFLGGGAGQKPVAAAVPASTCECPADTDQIAKYEWEDNAWVFEEEEGRIDAVNITGDAISGSWRVKDDFDYIMKAMTTKAGQNCHHTDYDPGQSFGTYSNEVVEGKDISYLEFCIPEPTVVDISYLTARSQSSPSLRPLGAAIGMAVLAAGAGLGWAINRRNSR